ncbi:MULTISPECIES: TusE/DsrC/DsvC family sulfur relay protein [Providencia]|uniref:Sulfurtransferase n=1 Tax=Providencia rettgeri TaxID=587 RepID=A0A3R8WVS4_PRORE|nr:MULTISPECIES: TusE/DsrC/DsvC family sulfur relay protein [Providencia]ELR5075633.1 TusE/DsrC/DsvC family sulfur relay protein [Providencia stuartii]ELR5071753.1 TusE/DsrC/DsvC family sulfur relay protein [Providencia rettgeri]ELR5215966.1 TusE/DsrC/DsvC family sulfur relay protein [Providencia rettgeri]ELR5222850.1 TusE/DsrC/DsvC family sulfur relay protein [Providencia rettgeri]MBV2191513.1 TusE/DsrC/DsvC family sulfur relay protein [Providencia rettgeri]
MLVFNNQEIETDAQGYLLDSQQWSEDLIPLLAQQEDIEITNEHLEIIRFVRNFYLEFNTSPAIRMLVKAVSQQFGEEKGNSRYLYRLFPKGPAKQATKLAGLPKPVKCI